MIPFVDIAKLSCTNNASVVYETKTCLNGGYVKSENFMFCGINIWFNI